MRSPVAEHTVGFRGLWADWGVQSSDAGTPGAPAPGPVPQEGHSGGQRGGQLARPAVLISKGGLASHPPLVLGPPPAPLGASRGQEPEEEESRSMEGQGLSCVPRGGPSPFLSSRTDEGAGGCAALTVSTGWGPDTAPAAWASTQSPWACPWGLRLGEGLIPPLAPSEASPAERALATRNGARGSSLDVTVVVQTQGGHAALCLASAAWEGVQVTPGPPRCPPPPSGEGAPGLGALKAEQRVRAPTLTLTLPAWGPFWSQRKLMTPHTPTPGSTLAPVGRGPWPTASRREPGASEWLQGRGETSLTKPNRSQNKQNLS